jgi:catechol 2,3-dioxygenase-like lactoylglutathione lyase family enzyme
VLERCGQKTHRNSRLDRDGLRVQLGGYEASARPSARPPCSVWVDVTGIGDLYSVVSDKGAIEWGPEVAFYRRPEFAFRDPDGHLIILSEITDEMPDSS